VTLGLWGDGDEIWAIEEAFKQVQAELPVEDAANWYRVGDVWASAVRVAPNLANSSEAWDLFRQGIASETAVDWREVTEETTLLDGRGHSIISRLFFSLKEWWKERRA
jgi:hypothetical protein